MGYDLHITRRRRWTDEGQDIAAEEWLACVHADPELRLVPGNGPCFAEWSGAAEPGWLDWSHGCVFTTHPDAALIGKMVAIAGRLGAHVQGDDGECYEEGGRRVPAKITMRERFARWLTRALPRRAPAPSTVPLPFAVGDRVRDVFGTEQVVIAIDRFAEHGMGVVRTRRSDGTVVGHAMISHGLARIGAGSTPDA